LLLLGVDTLEFGIEIEDYESTFRPLLNTFRELKEAAQEKGEEYEIEIDSLTLKVHGSGIRFYAYRLTCHDFIICFTEKELQNNTPVTIRFMSSYLWSYSVSGALERFMKWFDGFGAQVVATKISRADICVDTDEVSFVPSDGRGFVTRAKGRSRHGIDDEHSEGKVFTGFTIGRGQPMLARIYRKMLEVKRSGKGWFYELWALHGWEGDSEVWRVEFQLRRGVLKELGIMTVNDLLDNVDGVWSYCAGGWLTLRRPGSEANVSRWKVKRKWGIVQSAKFRELSSPLVREKVREGNLQQLMNQASGLAVSIAALGDHANLDTTLQSIGYWTEHRLSSKKTSFDGQKEARRSRFLKP